MCKCDHIVCDDNGKLLSESDFIAGKFNSVLRYCPSCDRYETELQSFTFCPKCGEKIDWLLIEGSRMKHLRETINKDSEDHKDVIETFLKLLRSKTGTTNETKSNL
jgi:hypothetical protein